MTTVFIDVSILVQTKYITGIQRVTSEVIHRLVNMPESVSVVILVEDFSNKRYKKINTEKFLANIDRLPKSNLDEITDCFLTVDDMTTYCNPTFFDLDSVWASITPRIDLYWELKKRNIRIVTLVYDVIVLSHPQFTSADNLVRFPAYITAVMALTDSIIVNTEYTKQEIIRIAKECGISRQLEVVVIPLGADFSGSNFDLQNVDAQAKQIAENGPFLLTVSTIEPRKNHALLLDAFDSGICQLGFQMVFAGRQGWNVDNLMKRIRSHPQYGKMLFHLEGMNDDTIRYLYKNAKMVLFPTYIEGFGLSTIEAIQHGTPVACSDIPVMHEVGKDYCDYFRLDAPADLVKIIKTYAEHPDLYEKQRNKLATYKTFTWDEMGDEVKKVLTEQKLPAVNCEQLRQMMMLTSRSSDFLATVPFIEQLMPFIEEIVIFCPKSTGTEIQREYSGRLAISYVYDEELLQGRKLPEDHQRRNFFIRALAIQHELLDDYFIMSDDDYRPLKEISQDFYIKDGRMNAFYFHDLDRYCSDIPVGTSFDQGMHRLNAFLKANNLPNLCYASHMPQVICKTMFREMLEKYPELLNLGCCEWSTYFNIESSLHPEAFHPTPYVTLMWPADVTNWERFYSPRDYYFENHYGDLYEENKLLAGCSQECKMGTHIDAEEKIRRYNAMWGENQQRSMEIFQAYKNEYRQRYGTTPQIMFNWENGVGIYSQIEYLRVGVDSCTRMKVEILDDAYDRVKKEGIKLDLGWNFGTEKTLYNRTSVIDSDHPVVFTFVFRFKGKAKMNIHLGYAVNDGNYHECGSIPVEIV